MAHKAQTRRMANAGKKPGVSSRRSLKPRGAFGESMRASKSLNPFDLKPEVRDALNERIQGTEQFWNDLSHQWFGSNPKSFPYNMSKWDAPVLSPPIKKNTQSLVTKQSQELPKENMGEREDNIWRKVLEGELTEKEGRSLIKEIKN